MEHNFTVKTNEAGERLDKWLCGKMRDFSRGQIKALLDGGRVLVNRRRVLIAGWEVEPDDTVEVRIPPNFEARLKENAEGAPEKAPSQAHARNVDHPDISSSIDRHMARKRPLRTPHVTEEKGHRPKSHDRQQGRQQTRQQPPSSAEKMRLKIYHEDKDLLVVEKPAGILSVAPEGGKREGENMVAAVHAYMKRKHQGSKGSFVAPLHRLDAETSGIMVFALSNNGRRLERQFKDHSIRREYTAVVFGRVEEERGLIDKPLEKGEFHGGRKVKVVPHGQGRLAVTEFRVKERYGNATLLEVRVRTGRTHQIRVHLAEKGHPLIGDKLYAEGAALSGPPFPRQALHAHTIGFKHPSTGDKLTFHSHLPDDIKGLIDQLRQA